MPRKLPFGWAVDTVMKFRDPEQSSKGSVCLLFFLACILCVDGLLPGLSKDIDSRDFRISVLGITMMLGVLPFAAAYFIRKKLYLELPTYYEVFYILALMFFIYAFNTGLFGNIILKVGYSTPTGHAVQFLVIAVVFLVAANRLEHLQEKRSGKKGS